MAISISRDALGVAHSVRKLPLDDRRRVLRLVELMLVARDDARREAQMMIRELAAADPETRTERVASLEETIRYLEQDAIPSQLI